MGRDASPHGSPGGDAHEGAAATRTDTDVLPIAARATAELPPRFGRYVLLDEIGRGGMGVVVSAWDTELERRVAVKVLHAELRDGTLGRARLLREAQAMARLSHPNVAHVYEVGEIGARVFLVMEYVEGSTLREWLTRGRDWREVVDVMIQAGRGLAAAHEVGLVHRDFKPSNVMLQADGRAIVLDFGLAMTRGIAASDRADSGALEVDGVEATPPKTGGEASLSSPPTPSLGGPLRRITRTGALVGTPAYMAPELLRGGAADEQSDQFAYFVTLYEALYGELPFRAATTAATLIEIGAGRVRPPPAGTGVPSWLRKIVMRGLAVEPRERHASMAAILDELRHGRQRRAPTRVVAALGIGAVFAAAWLADDAQTTDRCGGATERLAGVWDTARRDEVGRAFAATATPSRDAAWAYASTRMDAYADAWARMHRDACEATHVRGEQSGERLDLRMQCLNERRTDLLALADTFATADDRLVERAAEIVEGLPPLSGCEDPDALSARIPPPPAEVAESVERIRGELAQARTLAASGRLEPAKAVAAAACEDARALGYAPLVVEAQMELGDVQLDLHDPAGDTTTRRAYFDALVLGHHEVAMRAAMRIVSAETIAHQRFDAAHDWAEHARATMSLAGASVALEATLVGAEGAIWLEEGRWEEARALVELAVALWVQAAGPDTLQILRPLGALSNIATQLGRHEEAIAYQRRSLELARAIHGEVHPVVAQTLSNLGFGLLKRGDTEDALRLLEASVELHTRLYGEDGPKVASVLNNIGGVLNREGRHAEARQYLGRAYELQVRTYGPEHPYAAHPLNNIGNALFHEGRLAEARDHYARALRILEGALGAEHMHVSYPLVGLGRIAHLEGDFAAAREAFARATAIRREHGAAPSSVADAEIGLVRAEHAGGDPVAARARADRILAELRATESDDPSAREDIDDLEAWLADPNAPRGP